MKLNIFKPDPIKTFVAIGVIIIGTILLIEKLNGRFWLNDFKVMYLAADALMNNEQVYGTPFGLSTGYYKYSPFTLLLFIPYTLVSFDIASLIHFLIIGFSAITTVVVVEQIIGEYLFPNRKKHYLFLFLVLLFVMLHLVRELHLGNINMILLLLLSLSLYFALKSKSINSGLLLAIAILAKPYFLICLLPLIVNKKLKEVLSTVVWIIVFVLTSVLIIGLSKSNTLYQEWFHSMMEHSNYLSSNHTVFSLINQYFGVSIQAKYSILLLGIIGLISCIYFFAITNSTKNRQKFVVRMDGALIVHFFLLIAVVPNILITDTEHFLFSLPLLAILLYNLKKNSFWLVILFIILIFMYGGNSTDLLGRSLSEKVDVYGILGISNLIIIGAIVYFFIQNQTRLSTNEPLPTKK